MNKLKGSSINLIYETQYIFENLNDNEVKMKQRSCLIIKPSNLSIAFIESNIKSRHITIAAIP